MVPEAYASFLLTCLLVELTPGPNMGWLAILSLDRGRRAGLAAVTGVALGLAVVGLAAALGVATLVAASPALWEVLRWAGALFLLYLAWEGWSDAGSEEAPGERGFFLRGLVNNLLNPKAAMFYVAMLPAFLDPGLAGGWLLLSQTVLLSLSYVVVATAIHAGIVALAGSLRPWLTDAGQVRPVRRLLAVLLAGVALWFLWSTAR
jgi:threonine/homoserine/homoserine lactone efflux protein